MHTRWWGVYVISYFVIVDFFIFEHFASVSQWVLASKLDMSISMRNKLNFIWNVLLEVDLILILLACSGCMVHNLRRMVVVELVMVNTQNPWKFITQITSSCRRLSRGTHACKRTIRAPRTKCTQECSPQSGCGSDNFHCLCDGSCGFSCVEKGQFPFTIAKTGGKFLRLIKGDVFHWFDYS